MSGDQTVVSPSLVCARQMPYGLCHCSGPLKLFLINFFPFLGGCHNWCCSGSTLGSVLGNLSRWCLGTCTVLGAAFVPLAFKACAHLLAPAPVYSADTPLAEYFL